MEHVHVSAVKIRFRLLCGYVRDLFVHLFHFSYLSNISALNWETIFKKKSAFKVAWYPVSFPDFLLAVSEGPGREGA